MIPNGVTHAHAIKLVTFEKGTPVEKTEELYYIPDKRFHELRAFIRSISKKEE